MPNANSFCPSESSAEVTAAFKWLREQQDDDGGTAGAYCDFPHHLTHRTLYASNVFADAEISPIQGEESHDPEDDYIAAIDAKYGDDDGPSTWAEREQRLIELGECLIGNMASVVNEDTATEAGSTDDEDGGPLKEGIHKPQLPTSVGEPCRPLIFKRVSRDYHWSVVAHQWEQDPREGGLPLKPSGHQQRSWKNGKTRVSQHDKPHLSRKATAAKANAEADRIYRHLPAAHRTDDPFAF